LVSNCKRFVVEEEREKTFELVLRTSCRFALAPIFGRGIVAEEKDFQSRVREIGSLVHDLDSIADPASRAAAKKLVQFLMDLHGAGLERLLEIVFQSGESGMRVIDDLVRDPLVSGLLILYGFHPDDLQTRIERKLSQISSKLHKMGAEATLISIHEADVRIRVSLDRHACGSTSRTVQGYIEESMYEAAPDLTSLSVEGLEQPASSGFVAVESLAGSSPIPPIATTPHSVVGSDGMD